VSSGLICARSAALSSSTSNGTACCAPTSVIRLHKVGAGVLVGRGRVKRGLVLPSAP
jgi:hypothetical protein